MRLIYYERVQLLGKFQQEKIVKCVVIAAGQGTRLRDKAESKPLMTMLGIPLIERVIREAARAGIDEFCVVTGYKTHALEAFLSDLSARIGLKITSIYNPKWKETQNGASALLARSFIADESFILLMCDHLFDHTIIRELLDHPPQKGEVVLGVDRNLSNELIDLDDVTNVKEKAGRVVDIDKKLTKYNAFEVGIFYCSTECFDVLERGRLNGETSLTATMKSLAAKGKMRTMNIGGKFWIDVDDAASAAKAEKALLHQLKGKSNDGLIARCINRKISVQMTKWLVKTDLTPNQISLISFLASVIAALSFMVGNYAFLVLGGIIAQFASIIDGCDGEVSRLKYSSSEYGGWLDAVLDRYADGFLLFGLTLYAYQQASGSQYVLFIGFGAIIGSFVLSYTADKYDHRMQEAIQTGFYFRIGRDLRVFLILLIALTNQVLPGLIIIALIMNVEVVRRLWVCQNDSS